MMLSLHEMMLFCIRRVLWQKKITANNVFVIRCPHDSLVSAAAACYAKVVQHILENREMQAIQLSKRMIGILAVLLGGLAGCATETHQALPATAPETAARGYSGPKSALSVAKFDNRSSFLRGLFSDGVDRLGGQAKTILIGHLESTGRFRVLDRDNLPEIEREAKLKAIEQKLTGADVVLTGDVVEFGRKEVGDQQLFGILGSGKQQIAYSKVTLNVVDVRSSEVIFSVQGAGEYALSKREVLGFGGTASYDSTLNGKVLDLAIREAVDRLVEGLEAGKWTAGSVAP
jgi:curli biogenesis system outer membrane secretion channel CsgG